MSTSLDQRAAISGFLLELSRCLQAEVLGIPSEMLLLLSAAAVVVLALLMELLRPFER